MSVLSGLSHSAWEQVRLVGDPLDAFDRSAMGQKNIRPLPMHSISLLTLFILHALAPVHSEAKRSLESTVQTTPSTSEKGSVSRLAEHIGDQTRIWLGCTYNQKFAAGGQCDSSTWHGRAVLQGVERCQKAVARPICAEMIKKDANLGIGLRKCDIASVCMYNSFHQESLSFQKCKDGYILGTGELLTGLGEAFSSLTLGATGVVRSGIQNVRARNEFLKTCLSAECKLQVAREINPALGMSKIPELENLLARSTGYSAVWIEAERKRLEAVYFAQMRNPSPKTIWQRAQEAEELARRREASGYRTPESRIFEIAFEALQSKIHGLECFDQVTQIQLICWGAAYLVDPTIVAGAAAKGTTLARMASSHMTENATVFQARHTAKNLPRHAVSLETTVGRAIAELPLKGLPPTMKVMRYQNEIGEEILALEKAVRTPDGKIYKTIRELPVDPMTGTFDANFPVARQFLEDMVRELNGKVTLAVIDIDNLGFVSKNFTHGFQGTPAQGRASSMKIGDQYIAAVARALKEIVGDKGQVWRTGGDEFALVLHETNPERAKALLDRLAQRVRESDIREIFTKETRVRAQAFRDAKESGSSDAAQFRLGYAPYSQPNVSIGSVVVNQESLADAFAIAEQRASAHKIATKERFAADTTKYGGSAPHPDAIPRLGFIAPVQLPASGRQTSNLPRNSSANAVLTSEVVTATESRNRELFRVGEYSIVEYRNTAGDTLLRSEQYFDRADGTRSFSAPELFTNTKTGLIDGRHRRTRELMEAFTRSARTPNRGAIWINVENLGLANNFAAGGMTSGDRLLGRVAAILKDESDASRLPIKLPGSEFLILTENASASQLRSFSQRVQTRLAQDAEIKSIYDKQESHLRQRLKKAQSQTQSEQDVQKAQAALTKFLEARSKLFSVHETSINGAEELTDVLNRMRGQRYLD